MSRIHVLLYNDGLQNKTMPSHRAQNRVCKVDRVIRLRTEMECRSVFIQKSQSFQKAEN